MTLLCNIYFGAHLCFQIPKSSLITSTSQSWTLIGMAEQKISLACALKVDHSRLGARLETYVETRAAITAFRACISHSTFSAMGSLPAEIVAKIQAALQDLNYIPNARQGFHAGECAPDECTVRDHSSESEVRRAYRVCNGREKDVHLMLWEKCVERHPMMMKNHLRKIATPSKKDGKNVTKFTKCREVSLAGSWTRIGCKTNDVRNLDICRGLWDPSLLYPPRAYKQWPL